MSYYYTEATTYRLPNGSAIHVSRGGSSAWLDCLVVELHGEDYCNLSARDTTPPVPPLERIDTGHRPVWTDASGQVFLSWEEVGDSHLVNIVQYIRDIQPRGGIEPVLRDALKEAERRGLDTTDRIVRQSTGAATRPASIPHPGINK